MRTPTETGDTDALVIRPPADRAVPLRADVIGLLLAALLVAAIVVASADDGGRPGPAVAIVVAVVAAYVAGRGISTFASWVPPVVIVVVVTVVFVPNVRDVLTRAPLVPPMDYANANAALLFQGAIAATMVAAVVRVLAIRVVALVLAAAAIALAVASGSEAAVVIVGLALVVAAAATLGAGAWVPFALGGVLALMVAVTTVLGAAYRLGPDHDPVTTAAAGLVSERRLELWHDAWILMIDHPVTGVGPARFADMSPTARADADARWAHNEFLQLGAEAGTPALLLLAALFVWALIRIGLEPAVRSEHVIAAVGIAALGLHSTIDYVLHFWPVPVVAAALAAVPTARGRQARAG